jgi:hypothetical protein
MTIFLSVLFPNIYNLFVLEKQETTFHSHTKQLIFTHMFVCMCTYVDGARGSVVG